MNFYMDMKSLVRQGQTDSQLFRNFASRFETFIFATKPDPTEFSEFPNRVQKRLDVLQPRLEKLRNEARYGGLKISLDYLVQLRREVLMMKAAVRVVKGLLPIFIGYVGFKFLAQTFKDLTAFTSKQK